MSLARLKDGLSRVSWGIFGIKHAEVGTETANRDIGKLLRGAKELICYADAQLNYTQFLEEAINRGVSVQIILSFLGGQSKEALAVAKTFEKTHAGSGLEIRRSRDVIASPRMIVDVRHVLASESHIPGDSAQSQYVIKKSMLAPSYNRDFELLWVKGQPLK